MHVKNRSGSRIDPWETPQFKIPAFEKTSSTCRKKFIFHRQDSNNYITDVQKARLVIFSRRILQCVVRFREFFQNNVSMFP